MTDRDTPESEQGTTEIDDAPEPHRPKHRRDDVPVDGELALDQLGEEPDTERAV